MTTTNTVAIIVAISLEGLIGRDGQIPWMGDLPIDMARFKGLTIGKAVIMGRKTFESLPDKYRPLPNRLNIVLSTTLPKSEEYSVCSDLESAIDTAVEGGHSEIFIIGGERVYAEALEAGIVDIIYLTRVLKDSGPRQAGDAYFSLPVSGWVRLDSTENPSDSKNKYSCRFEAWISKTQEVISNG